MSDEQHKGEEPEVEVHHRHLVNVEPEVEDDDNEFEAHIRKSNVRMDSPRHI
jgi:hypothetical protein